MKNSSILFSLANVEFDSRNYSAAIALLRECLANDGGSYNTKRVFLADALSWCALDRVQARHGHFSKDQRDALSQAVALFEPLEQILPAIQSDTISEEVASNIVFSLILLNKTERAYALANNALLRHPLSEGLLRTKLQELDEKNDIQAIRDLTDPHLQKLPVSIIGSLVQCAANHGEMTWYLILMDIVEAQHPDIDELDTLRAFALLAKWKSGETSEALEDAQAYLGREPDSIIARLILAQILIALGKNEEASNEAIQAKSLISSNSTSVEALQVAELLFKQRLFYEASVIYSNFVTEPGSDEITRNLLICLVESDQRRKARDLFERLSTEVKAQSEFRIIEANLARRMGDWALMTDLLATEIAKNPEKASIAVHYVGALYRLGTKEAKETLLTYLESDPYFKDTSLEAEFEFAKYQSSLGLSRIALNRLYRQFRDNSQNVKAASIYLGHIVIGRSANEILAPESVGSGCAVYLQRGSDTRCIAIDIEKSKVQSWPELVSPESDHFKLLKGLKLGDEILLNGGFPKSKFKIMKLVSIHDFAAHKANDLVSIAAEPTGPIFSVRVINEDGSIDTEALLESAKQRKEHVQLVFDVYKKHRFPIAMLADFLGTDPVTLTLEWPYKDISFFVGVGTHQERDNAYKLIIDNRYPYVLDLLTIAELVQRKCFNSVTKLIGRPLITTTTKEHLMMLLELANTPQPSASLREDNGQLIMTETPQSYYESRLIFLQEMRDSIDKFCEVAVTTGPEVVTDKHMILGEAVGSDGLDVVYLCIERNAVLISEDGAFRIIATEAGVRSSVSIQPILLACLNAGAISQQQYSNIVFEKLVLGHDFVSIKADDMLTAAKRTPYRVNDKVKLGLETFRKDTLDIASGLIVCCEFLQGILPYVQVKTTESYLNLMLDVLQHERQDAIKTAIRIRISRTILAALNSPKCKLKHKEKRVFDKFIVRDEH